MSDSTGSIGTRGRRPWRRWLRAGAPLAALAVVLWMKPMGLLLWARLRILTNLPRTAIAEDPPEHAGAFPDPQGMSRVEGCGAEDPVPAPRCGR